MDVGNLVLQSGLATEVWIISAYICGDDLKTAPPTTTPAPSPTEYTDPCGAPDTADNPGSGSNPGGGTGTGGNGAEKTASSATSTAPTSTAKRKSTGPASPNSINTVSSRTLYIGNLYEEDISNTSDPTPPYTSYYTFGGKLVGMRLANQPDPSTDGQLRVVGDHLGSATLTIDTQSPPQVIHRQYYKPYGEVALSSGSSRTSIGYTEQRLYTDSGLMIYGARMYDPQCEVLNMQTCRPVPNVSMPASFELGYE